MTTLPSSSLEPVTEKSQLVAYAAGGSKPRSEWRIGTEHEKFVVSRDGHQPVPYEGPSGIKAMLDGFTARFGWQPIREGDNVIALVKDGASITLEPGGQLELSGAPLETLHQTCDEVHTHLAQSKIIGDAIGVRLFGLGFHPTARRDDIHWMPKGRYKIMRAYMPKRDSLGLDMMLRTCTVQVNLDFDSEATMVRMFRVSLALQPVAIALFANSPFTEGKPNGFVTYRSHVWTKTDPDRTGFLPFVFEPSMGFERYVDYVLDIPMYFVYRDGRYIDAAGQSFRDFMRGRLPALPGEVPRLGDWVDHLTTAFPEVRLKRFLEMRGADGGPWGRLCALPALWTGLLYDPVALDAAWEICRDWSTEERLAIAAAVPTLGLKTPFRSGTLQDVARDVVAIATAGLKARKRLSRHGRDESGFLDPLAEIAASGRTPAEELLDAYRGEWGGRIEPVFDATVY